MDKQNKDEIANNNDLLIEILACLPVKSLLRFKSVSKLWLSLISSQYFCRYRFPDHHHASGLFLSHESEPNNPEYDFISCGDKPASAPFRSLTSIYDPSGIKILHSCHGLLLCCSSNLPTFELANYYIYNPTTKQFVGLPYPCYDPTTNQYVPLPQSGSKVLREMKIVGMNLAFEPSKSPHYKVVCIQNPNYKIAEGRFVYQIHIYSSEMRSWKLFSKPFPLYSDALFRPGVFCNGALHWIGTCGKHLCFIIDEDRLHDLPMPPIPKDWEEIRTAYFGESRGHLHLVEIYNSPTTQFGIYEMEEDYSKWFVKYLVDLDVVTAAYPEMVRGDLDPSHLDRFLFNILCVVREAKDEESYLVIDIPGAIIRYNLEEKTSYKICSRIQGNCIVGSFQKFRWWGIHKFVESLSCV